MKSISKNCRRKFPHVSKGKAEAHARHVFRERGVVLDTYLCPYCRCWHVGHAMNKMKQRELERQYSG